MLTRNYEGAIRFPGVMESETLGTNPVGNDISRQYLDLLREYLDQGGEDPLMSVYELGRRALAEGLGLLDMTSLHRGALTTILLETAQCEANDPRRGMQEMQERVQSAARFLDEALSPFEVSRLSSKDPNTALRRLYEVLEEESKRIAHILHDESAQMLATAYLELAEIARESPGPVANKVQRVVGHLDEVREQLRRLSHELRPLILDQLGLIPALRFLANGVKKRSGLEVEIKGETSGRLSQAIETVLYRTVQEALNNVCRHARASRAEVRVWIDRNMIYCSVRDNGVGFRVPDQKRRVTSSLGLVGIQERVDALHGESRITSEPGKGTELQVAIPL